MKLFKNFVFFMTGGLLFAVIVASKSSFVLKGKTSLANHFIPTNELFYSDSIDLIRYGKKLIDSTSIYLGPRGSVAAITNGLNCQNCHRESGTKLYTNNFLAVASTYPKFRERSGKVESVEFRVNECLQRSLNGEAIDSLSREMRAMVAYIKFTGENITKETKTEGVGSKDIDYISRAADPLKGAAIYKLKCKTCHGRNGEGKLSTDSLSYLFPPLWGAKSYAVSAGMYRLTKLASFIRNNMPLGATYQQPQLRDEEAWDLAAYINSQPHPKRIFPSDWPSISAKPVDYPFGPFADAFTEKQHKYGPFINMKKASKK
jgi:thiosulfate dehydrogenase